MSGVKTIQEKFNGNPSCSRLTKILKIGWRERGSGHDAIVEEEIIDNWEGHNKWGGWQKYKKLDDMKETVVTIHRKDPDNFEGQY